MDTAYLLEDVSFSYKNKLIIDKLSLSIPNNSVCAIMGPNGSGKTTLLNLLLGWLKPDSGTIIARNKNLNSLSSRERGRLISLLPQIENINLNYTVMEHILLGRAPHINTLQQPGEEDFSIALSALQEVDGLSLKDRKLPTLSGGETQTSLLARSLTQQPEILLLDEPANHLDPARKRKMLNIIGGSNIRNRTVIFTTHAPEDTIGTTDYLILVPVTGPIKYGSFESMFTEENLSELYGIEMKITKHDRDRVSIFY
jgi:iron complex transport system ATP-binding protein